ncbi:hypothetical protein CPB85DRAFT_1295513 [Mucidula mucida]|nr:hypothetical protein CPB85DRAFT_1295513 [Mucidula mucida]
MDDDDDFLYGTSAPSIPAAAPAQPLQVSQPSPIETGLVSNGLVSHLEAKAEAEDTEPSQQPTEPDENEDNVEDDEGEAGEEESEDEDIEIIMEPTSRSLDLRQNRPQPAHRIATTTTQPRPSQPGPSVTTEYTPLQRGASSTSLQTQASHPNLSSDVPSTSIAAIPPITTTPAPSATPAPTTVAAAQKVEDDGIDTSKLPAATAPPSHPAIDPSVVGFMDGRSILEVDLAALSDKPWRKPGSDISDWFNYGFDEISWEAYCYRRRDLGDLAHVLKASVLNFSGMPEEQVTALPPEVRQMVMTGTNAMLSNNGPNPAMMMDMGMMNPMAMGMTPDMSMMQGMMPDGQGQGIPGANGTPEPMMQEGYAGGGPGMMMGSDYGMQDQSQMGVQQQMYQGMEGPQATVNAPVGPSGRGGTPVPYRGRGVPLATGPRASRGFVRGRGGRPSYEGGSIVRPASPLPPNVPTGPRNQNKYKDRDGNAPAVDGLDYGGGGGRTSSGEPEDRSRKRRGSPVDDGRSSKRR